MINSNTFHNIWKNFRTNIGKKEKKTKKKLKENNSMSKNHKNFH